MQAFMPPRADETGVVEASKRQRLSGLELLSRIASGELPGPPMSSVMRMRITEVERGRVRFRGEPDATLLNTIGSVHGGFAMTLLDSCMACAVHTLLSPGRAYTTAEIKVNLVRAIMPDSGPMTAEGSVVHPGRRLATAEGRLSGDDGKLYAHGTMTCFVFDLER